jgi:hypothetical protein
MIYLELLSNGKVPYNAQSSKMGVEYIKSMMHKMGRVCEVSSHDSRYMMKIKFHER